MPKMSHSSSATTTTLPMPSREANSALTTTLSSGTREMTRSGLSTLRARSALIQGALKPLRETSMMESTTMIPSSMFHAEAK